MRQWKKIFKYLLIAILAVLVLDAGLVFGMASKRRLPEKADAIIILGAAINTPALYNRSLEGLRLFQQGRSGKMVLSGGRVSDKDISEAQYMEKVILARTAMVPQLVLEENSHSTYENIVNSRKVIPEAKSVIVVSDKYHVARGVVMARAAGFSEVYWSWPEPTYYSFKEMAYYYVREMAAMVVYLPKFFGM